MLLPASFVYINSTPGAVVDVGFGILPANRALHLLPPIGILYYRLTLRSQSS